jgi:hypothetical protein
VFFTLLILVLSVALSQTGFTGEANTFKTFWKMAFASSALIENNGRIFSLLIVGFMAAGNGGHFILLEFY